MKCLILAGGSGTRLWPLSRQSFPKQFLKLAGQESFLQKTARRCLRLARPEEVLVLSNSEYKFLIRDQFLEIEEGLTRNILLEPAGRNTAPAIALGVKYCLDKLGCTSEEVMFIGPSDHIILPEDRFATYVGHAAELAAKGQIVTFGVVPNRPETGYGYIRRGKEIPGLGCGAYEVAQFVEKPNLETACRYLETGEYFFNSGMFVFRIGTIVEAFRSLAPEIGALFEGSFEEALARFETMPNISIDYAIMEKFGRVGVLPLDLTWSDVGSWDSVYENLPHDEAGNVCTGSHMEVGTRNCLVMGDHRLVATIGLENVMIIDTPDALLVSRREESQRVREIVDRLKQDPHRRPLAEIHTTVHRPWGSYTLLEEGPRYKLKRIVVNPGAQLSLQRHYHRSEHWVVIKGTAQVTIGEGEQFIHENESIYVPKTTMHRLGNPGKVPLEIIEVQVGEYVGEDDIERFSDLYDRKTPSGQGA